MLPNRRITVLIAIYEAGRFIKAKIDNIRQQTIFHDANIVLLNCQNKNNESGIYADFHNAHDNVIEIKYDQHVRLYPTWNDGIKATMSTYICNSNVDDMLHPMFLQKCCDWLDANPDYACVSSSVLVTRSANQIDHTAWQWDNKMPFRPYPESSAGPCPVWRRALHEKYGYFGNYRVIGDARLWEKWYYDGREKFGLLDEDLVLYYRHKQSLETRSDDTGTTFRDLDIAEDTTRPTAQ